MYSINHVEPGTVLCFIILILLIVFLTSLLWQLIKLNIELTFLEIKHVEPGTVLMFCYPDIHNSIPDQPTLWTGIQTLAAYQAQQRAHLS